MDVKTLSSIENISCKLDHIMNLLTIFTEFYIDEVDCEMSELWQFQGVFNRMKTFMSTIDGARETLDEQIDSIKEIIDCFENNKSEKENKVA